MMDYAVALGLVVAAYVVGSIPFGYLFARARGIDIRQRGSGNIGAVNVARSLGKKLGLVVLLLDALKGAIPVLAARWLGLHESVDPFVITAAGVAAISGHCFPVWLGFRGGKGVATTLGVFIVVDPLITLVTVMIFVIVYAIFRIASLGSIVAVASLPVWLLVAQRGDEVVTLAIASALIVIAKHAPNIRRLLRGQEHKL